MTKQRDDDKHAAGGPGKSSKEGHIDPSKHNKPGQKQAPESERAGGGGQGGGRGANDDRRHDAG